MSMLVGFGDSYLGLSATFLDAKAAEYGFTTNWELVDPSRTVLDWLFHHQAEITNLNNSLPEDAVWYWSMGGVDRLNDMPKWQLRQTLNQLIELMDCQSHSILHFGYEWWPPTSGVDERMEPLYEALLELDAKHRSYRFIEMRGAVPFDEVEYIDVLHLSPANYERRVEHAWDTQLKYVL